MTEIQLVPQQTFLQEFNDRVQQAKAMRQALAQVIRDLLVENIHYGVMPGTTGKEGEPPKKVLFKAGAEMLCNVFHFVPHLRDLTKTEESLFIHREVECQIQTPSGVLIAVASGSANTREERYYNQCTSKVCPHCKKPAIFKSKKEPYGWYCWDKKGGCGAKFAPEDKAILGQDGQLTEVKVWGLHNTILQQANKRAMVAAVRLATACSDTFTQDMMPDPTDEQPEDDGQHQAARQQSRAPTNGQPIARKTDLILALNKELSRLGVGIDDRVAWVNAKLEAMGMAKVSSIIELSPENMAALATAAATVGK